MQSELYLDISSTETGGSLYRHQNMDGSISFLYEHSTYDAQNDEIKVFRTSFSSFEDFWLMLTKDSLWFYRHPLFVHPELRAFIEEKLSNVNWQVQGDAKWQESHKRQWRKVLSDPGNYYKPM